MSNCSKLYRKPFSFQRFSWFSNSSNSCHSQLGLTVRLTSGRMTHCWSLPVTLDELSSAARGTASLGKCPRARVHENCPLRDGTLGVPAKPVDPALRTVLITNTYPCQLQNSVHPTSVNNAILLWEGSSVDQQPTHFCVYFLICSFKFCDTCEGNLSG